MIIADAAFSNHQNRVGKDPLYHIQTTKCMMCIVQEKSKHNRYRSTMRQMKVALSKNKFKFTNKLVSTMDLFVSTYPLSALSANTAITNLSLATLFNSYSNNKKTHIMLITIYIAFYYFKLKNNVQRSRGAQQITDYSDPDAHSEIVKALNSGYLCHYQCWVPYSDAEMSGASRQTVVQCPFTVTNK